MTRKLYQDDSCLWEFSSRVRDVRSGEKGFEIILEATAFYPESGGQLADRGTLDDNEVRAVILDEEDNIIHVCRDWKALPGTEVIGRIDKERRLEHMRQHTGQHILSGAFIKAANIATVSAHLGDPECSIELDCRALDDEILARVETLANEVVRDNSGIDIGYFDREELEKLQVRKIPDRQGKFRIVSIGEHDRTACGGTHCQRTGEVGLIKIIGAEKIRNRVRLTFLTGAAAVTDGILKNNVANRLSTHLTCHIKDIPEAVEKLRSQNAELRGEIGRLNRELMPFEIEKLRQKAVAIGPCRIIFENREGSDPKTLRNLAGELAKDTGTIVIFMFGDKLLIAASTDAPLNAAGMASLFTSKIGGKGGGNPALAQIGNIAEELRTDCREKFLTLLGHELEK